MSALPQRDGTWIINPGNTAASVVRVVSSGASWRRITYAVSLRQTSGGFVAPVEPSGPAPHSLAVVDRARWPDDLPGTLVAVRGSTNDLVRVDTRTGVESVLVSFGPPITFECPDQCSGYTVSVTPDGTTVVYGGPGPAAGQLYRIPIDGSTPPALSFAGSHPAMSRDGLLVSSAHGLAIGPLSDPSAAKRVDIDNNTQIAASFSNDDSLLYVAVDFHNRSDIVALDPRDPAAVLRPIAGLWNVHWDAIAVRQDGQIVAFRRPTPTSFATADVIDAASGRVIDRVALTSAKNVGSSPWIDFDSSGRYLLHSDQYGGLRWTDFDVVGTIGTGLGDGGW